MSLINLKMRLAYWRKQHDDKKKKLSTQALVLPKLQPGPEAFLISLHACQTVENFYNKVYNYYSCQPQESPILNDRISRIAIYINNKQHALVQHEAIVMKLTPPDYGFNIFVDRTCYPCSWPLEALSVPEGCPRQDSVHSNCLPAMD